jgi:hypothetical protein
MRSLLPSPSVLPRMPAVSIHDALGLEIS